MKAYDYEAVTYDSAVYCCGCLPDGITTNSEGVMPIFADSEHDSYPCCDHCGEIHDYVNLTSEGIEYELGRQHQEFFQLSANDFMHAPDGSWQQNRFADECPNDDGPEDQAHAESLAGWFYWTCLPGCLPDSDPTGPFKTRAEAVSDAADAVLF